MPVTGHQRVGVLAAVIDADDSRESLRRDGRTVQPVRVSRVSGAVTPMVEPTPMGIARWELRQARSIEPDLLAAMMLVEAAHAAEPPADPHYPPVGWWPVERNEWVPDTRVEEEFVRRTIAALDAAERRAR